MLFRRNRVEYSDGIIDLIPIHIGVLNRELALGHEQIWKITLHDQKQEIGQISYRDGEGRNVYFFGHIGYHIDPPYRGKHYAFRACRLIAREIRLSGKSSVVITCDPDNEASRKTCIRLGCCFERITDVPEDIYSRFEISHTKCRYIWHIESTEER